MPTRGSSLERVSAASRARADLELVSLDTHSGGVDDEQLLPPPLTPLQRLVARFVTTNNAVAASWVVNIFLLAAKIAAFISTNSKAVLASLADSAGARRARNIVRRLTPRDASRLMQPDDFVSGGPLREAPRRAVSRGPVRVFSSASLCAKTSFSPFSHARPERGWKRSACWAARASCRVRPPRVPSLPLSPT